jgi:uncharacterized membrane protein YcaP (DUF421 family)
MKTDPYEHPRTIIKEGTIITSELKEIQKNEEWVTTKLERIYQTSVSNVLLATIDNKDNLKIFLYK